MARGDTANSDSAAERLAELHSHFREHPVTGPAGHSYISSEPRPTAVAPALPFNAGVADHISASLQEIAEHTRAANPEAGPLPERVRDSYAWMREHTEHASESYRFRAEVIEYRQWLEHCLQGGDHEPVRKQVRTVPCPECGCWGLMWMAGMREAYCTNTDCTDPEGFSTHLTLSRLAHTHVAAKQKIRQARAT